MKFAETAGQAWNPPRGLRGRARAFARRRILAMHDAATSWPEGDFIRCIYSHAVFPEAKPDVRTFVRTLKNQGDFIDTSTLIAMISKGEPVRGRYFHLSFDDGFANVYEEGGDVFASEGVPYSIFVPTDLMDAPYEKLDRYNRERLKYRLPVRTMTWDQLRACDAAGGEIGCHTRTHARLSAISGDPALLHEEIAGAKAKIEAELGKPCIAFAWPFGMKTDIDETARRALVEAGFEIVFSAVRGRVVPGSTSLHDVPRQQVEFHWPLWENLLWARGCREQPQAGGAGEPA